MAATTNLESTTRRATEFVPTSSSEGDQPMDRELLKACRRGDVNHWKNLILLDPDILLSTTPLSNNCLHIAAMLGHEELAKEVWSRAPSLFSGTNIDGETPLIAALMAANNLLASDMITAASQHLQPDSLEGGKPMNEMLLKVDSRGENALHHAIRNGLGDLAVRLLNIEPRLSEQVSQRAESPMHMAARRGYSNVAQRLLDIASSADSGPNDDTALHVAVTAGHKGIVEMLLKGRPRLAYHKNKNGNAPLGSVACDGNVEIVKSLLEHDPNLAYIVNEKTGQTPFLLAAFKGFVPVAEEIVDACPDSAYITNKKYGTNALHQAIFFDRPNFVDYILRTPQLHRLINQADNNGDLPLHYAARDCKPEILRSLLSHKRQDYTAVNAKKLNAVDIVYGKTHLFKTLKWNESFTLVANAIPSGWRNVAQDEAKKEIRKQAIQEVKSLTERYISNTSLVAALLATITFAAAFTLPGGFSSDPSDAGLPVFAREAAFMAFLIFDTIAMCSSLAVTFLCVLATWEDMDYLLNYRKTTRVLMWCAYVATSVAFATGLFTVVAPKSLWLALLILVFCIMLPFLSMILGEWPQIMLFLRLGRLFQPGLLPNI